MRRHIPLIAVSIFLCGCPRPAQYVRPGLPVPATWPAGAAGEAGTPGAPAPADLKWQEFFGNQRLRSTIELALANNRDLRMASLNSERVQALYRIQRAEQYPAVVASASGDVYRVPRTLSGADDETVAQFRVGVGVVSWELDLFGRVRSLKSRALEQYLASEQARAATQISLVAAVANTYLVLAADREILALSRESVNAQQAVYELIRQSRDIGIASDLEVRQAQTQVEAARVDVARYSGQVVLGEQALTLLVGASLAPETASSNLPDLGVLKDVAPGMPSDVLLRRPDILAAEHQLKAANANIGAARAAFFPRISLTAAAGIISSDLTNLFKPAAGTWDFNPQATIPIFDAGARQANYDAVRVERDMAVAAYEKAIQTAFNEASDALSLRTTLQAQQDAQQALVNALAETYRLSEIRYKSGIDSYLSVLIAQRALYNAQQSLIVVRLARLGNLVTLYKVLGGGV